MVGVISWGKLISYAHQTHTDTQNARTEIPCRTPLTVRGEKGQPHSQPLACSNGTSDSHSRGVHKQWAVKSSRKDSSPCSHQNRGPRTFSRKHDKHCLWTSCDSCGGRARARGGRGVPVVLISFFVIEYSEYLEEKTYLWNRARPTYSFPALCCAFTSLVARSMHTIRHPVTLGSSVPLWPVFSTRRMRLIHATTFFTTVPENPGFTLIWRRLGWGEHL